MEEEGKTRRWGYNMLQLKLYLTCTIIFYIHCINNYELDNYENRNTVSLFLKTWQNHFTFLHLTMYALNRIQIIGHLTEKPEVRQLENGTSVCDLNIKSVEKVTKEDGSPITLSSYHTVTLWRRMAEIAGDYCTAGGQVYISGRIKTDSWEVDGQKKYKTKVVSEDLILLDSRKEMAPLDESSVLSGGINQAEIIGNVTRDPELRQTTSGQHVVNFSVATNRKWQDRNTGESKEETEFHPIVAWGDLAREVAEKIKTGQKIYARGRLQTRSWETPDGEKRYTTEIIADQALSLGAKSAELAMGTPAEPAAAVAAPAAAVAASGQGEAPKADAKQTEAASVPAAAPAAEDKEPELPTIKYESDIKPADLPF